MKLFVCLLACSSMSLGSPQFGFLNNLFNGFRPRPNNNGGGRPSGGGGGRCGGGHRPNHQFGGQNFLVSWRIGCSGFTQVRDAILYFLTPTLLPIRISVSFGFG